MSAHETNGRIKLTWPQFVWGIALLVAVLMAWGDLRSELRATRLEMIALRSELNYRVAVSDREHATYDKRLDRLEGRRAP